MPLAAARRLAAANRLLVKAGGDPLEGRRRAKVPTFREAAERTYRASRPRRRNAKVAAVWLQSMERYAFPIIGPLPVNRVGRGDGLKILTPIWSSEPETARKLRQADQVDPRVVPGAGLRGAQRGRGAGQRRPAGHAPRAGAPQVVALPEGPGGP